MNGPLLHNQQRIVTWLYFYKELLLFCINLRYYRSWFFRVDKKYIHTGHLYNLWQTKTVKEEKNFSENFTAKCQDLIDYLLYYQHLRQLRQETLQLSNLVKSKRLIRTSYTGQKDSSSLYFCDLDLLKFWKISTIMIDIIKKEMLENS